MGAAFGGRFAVMLSGIAVGWLVGLSLSPVVHTVVGALVALVGALVGLVAQETPRDGGADHQPKPRPILASVQIGRAHV